MKFSGRLLTLFLVSLIMVSSVFGISMSASAAKTTVANTSTQSRDYNFSKGYNLTGNGAVDIVAVARAQVGKSKSNLGYTEAWCADFVSDCAKLAGQSSAIPFNGGVAYMYNAVLGAGGYKVSTPQAGDLVFYYCTSVSSWCHVAIMTDSVYSIQGNVNNAVLNIKYGNYCDQYGQCYSVTFLRPNYKASASVFGTPVDLGDGFYASLVKSSSGVYLANVNGNVQLADYNTINDNSHIWKFVRQSDNSYFLYNCATGTVMDVANAGMIDGTNVSMCPLNSSDAQKWYFYKQSDGSYVIRPKLCVLVLDAASGSDAYGTNIQLWTYNQSTAQMFSVVKQEPIKAPTLSVIAGDYKTLTTFKCNTDKTPVNYDLVISTVSGSVVSPYKTINMVQNETFMYELPVGKYQAYAQVSNGYTTAKSVVVTFEVAGKPVVDADGWTYHNILTSGISPANYEIQYKYTYTKVAAESPGAGWVKGDFAEKQYVNSGEPYWSNIELATSDTRILLDYYYYHFCGGSSGNVANFAATSSLGHYDSLSKNGVYEYSVTNDYDDSRYKFYHLKWADGSDAYCSSGVSCDGSFGSHGNRSYYWYKSSQYQDKVAVDCYNYTKTGDWTTKIETNGYVDVTYRYRLKDDALFGDANGDGRVSIADATTIQKHCASIITLSDSSLTIADTDRNGRVSVSDATKIQKFLAGIITEL